MLSEPKRGRFLELPEKIVEAESPTQKDAEYIANLEKQHELNLQEKAKLTELKQQLEMDEADLSKLRYEVLELIRDRLVKK